MYNYAMYSYYRKPDLIEAPEYAYLADILDEASNAFGIQRYPLGVMKPYLTYEAEAWIALPRSFINSYLDPSGEFTTGLTDTHFKQIALFIGHGWNPELSLLHEISHVRTDLMEETHGRRFYENMAEVIQWFKVDPTPTQQFKALGIYEAVYGGRENALPLTSWCGVDVSYEDIVLSSAAGRLKLSFIKALAAVK